MRDISIQMVQSHFKQRQDEGRIGRIEFLPVRWHDALHGAATGVDRYFSTINHIFRNQLEIFLAQFPGYFVHNFYFQKVESNYTSKYWEIAKLHK